MTSPRVKARMKRRNRRREYRAEFNRAYRLLDEAFGRPARDPVELFTDPIEEFVEVSL